MFRALLLLLLPLTALSDEASWPQGLDESRLALTDDPSYSQPGFDDNDWEHGEWWMVERREPWWLRARLQLPRTDEPLALYVAAMAATEVYLDGELLGRNGRVGSDPDSERPGRLHGVFPLPQGGDHELAIRFSSQHAGRLVQTPVDAIYIAPYGSPLHGELNRYLPTIVASGGLLLALVVLLVMAVRHRDTEAAWLALACTGALAQGTAEVTRALWNYPYDWHSLRLTVVAAGALLTGVGVIGFLLRRYHPTRTLWWLAPLPLVTALGLLLAGGGDYAAMLVALLWLLGGIGLTVAPARAGAPAARLSLLALAVLLMLLVLEQGAFLDRTAFLGVIALLLLFFIDHLRRHAQLRREREQAELRSVRLERELLKHHLRPHFLLNTLTTLSEWIETDPPTGSRMIQALAEEFRRLHAMLDRPRVPLAEEIELCRCHLAVMSLRHDARYGLDVSGDVAGVEVPPAVIHTLLENALSHNRYRDGEVRFQVSVTGHDGTRQIVFAAPAAAPMRAREGSGIGMAYVEARMAESFAGSRVRSRVEADGWTTTLTMPVAVSR